MKKPIGNWIKQSLMTGIFALLPVSITAWLLYTLFKWADGFIYSFINAIVPSLNPKNYIHFQLPIFGTEIEGIPGLGILLLIIILCLIGALTRFVFIKYAITIFDNFVEQIPFANKVYFSLRQIMKTISKPGAEGFRRVVLVQYPREGVYSMAFVTGTAPYFGLNQKDKMLSLFMPTTPNPTTGFYFIVPEKDTIPITISIEDAFKIIISGGVLTPEDIREKQELSS